MTGLKDFDPVSVPVACEGEQHEVAWNHEGLHLKHHDYEAERAQEVLGGRIPECVALKRAWELSAPIRFSNEQLAAIVAPDVLAGISSGYLGKSQLDRLLEVHRNRSGGAVRKLIALSKAHFPDQEGLPTKVDLHDLEGRSGDFLRLALQPEPLRKRYGATALTVLESAWGNREQDNHIGPQPEWIFRVTASYAYERVKEFWREHHEVALPPIEWGVGVSGQDPLRAIYANNRPTLQLPLDWLRTVWLQGAAWVDGLFIVKGAPVSRNQRRALALTWTVPRRKTPVPEIREVVLSRLGMSGWRTEETG